MHYESNIDELARETRPSAARMDAPAAGGTVGDAMARALARRIAERGERGEGSDGRWDRNAPATARRKGFDKPNYETEAMMDPRHIAGEVASGADEVAITYGTGEADADGVSDRDRAWYANEAGQGRPGLLRPFFAMTDSDQDALTELAGDAWDAAAGGPGGASAPRALPAP